MYPLQSYQFHNKFLAMGDDFVRTEQLMEKYLKKIEKQINDALDGFKKEQILTKKFIESFLKKAIER